MKRNDQKYLQCHKNTITPTKDGRWSTNCRDTHGKRKKITCPTREDLEKEIIAFYKEAEAQASLTFPIICKEWLDEKIQHKEITPASYTKYLGDYRRFFIDREDNFCKMSVAAITDSDLRRFIKDSIVDMNLTKKTYKQMKILLKGALLYAKEEG